MKMLIKDLEQIKILNLVGDIDANTAPQIQQEVLPLASSSNIIAIDMTKVDYMSSAGLRLLLSLYRQTTELNGELFLVGLSSDLQDTMAVTGFLDFFRTVDTVEEVLSAIK